MISWYCYTLVYAIIISTVNSQSCESEILRISNAGKIETSSDAVAVGQSVNITCSTDCAYYWHTILVDGEVYNTASATEGSGFLLSVSNVILNCPDCTDPDDADCSLQQGPVQSILNFTLLQYGDHYLQCIAHMFHPDSDLWPNNRIISIPSKMVKITGVNIEEEASSTVTELTSSTTTGAVDMTEATPTCTSAISSTSTMFISQFVTVTSTVKVTTSISNSFISSTDAHSTAIKSPISEIPSTASSSLMTKLTMDYSTSSLIHDDRTYEINRSQMSSSSSQGARLTTERLSMLPTPTDVIIDTDTSIDQVSSTCDQQFTMNNITVYAILATLSIICLILIMVIIVLIIVNKRSASQYNQLSLSIPSPPVNHYHVNCTDIKLARGPATKSTSRASLTA